MASRALGVSFSLSASLARVMIRDEVNWRKGEEKREREGERADREEGEGEQIGRRGRGSTLLQLTTKNSFMRSFWCSLPWKEKIAPARALTAIARQWMLFSCPVSTVNKITQ